MGDDFYRSEDPTNSIKVLNEIFPTNNKATANAAKPYSQSQKYLVHKPC